MAKMNVKDTEITVVQINNEDYLCLTDMIKAKDGDFFITDWLRSRDIVEFLGLWECLHNPDFKRSEFDTFKSQSLILKGVEFDSLLRKARSNYFIK